MQRILIISPHTDDAELGCGGSIARWIREAYEVRVIHLSDTRNLFGKSHGIRLRAEALEAAQTLGVPDNHVEFHDFPTRRFTEVRQEILDTLISANRLIQPALVIGPDTSDSHQDHQVVANEISRAFKGISVLSFDTYWNLVHQSPELILELSEEEIEKKCAALKCYLSQQARAYMEEEIVRSHARIRGLPRNFKFAEAFAVVQLSVNTETLLLSGR